MVHGYTPMVQVSNRATTRLSLGFRRYRMSAIVDQQGSTGHLWPENGCTLKLLVIASRDTVHNIMILSRLMNYFARYFEYVVTKSPRVNQLGLPRNTIIINFLGVYILMHSPKKTRPPYGDTKCHAHYNRLIIMHTREFAGVQNTGSPLPSPKSSSYHLLSAPPF